MRFAIRWIWLVLLLGGAMTGELLFKRHLDAAGPLPVVPLRQPLVELPLQLGDWQGVDRPVTDQDWLYADEHLQRTYINQKRRQALTLWLVYSQRGADRGHHPEVCMMVAGKPEDTQARRTCPLDGNGGPAQQYRFGRPGDFQWVLYWHYTLLPPADSERDALQRLHQRLRHRPSSLTVEIFAPEVGQDDGEGVQEFARLADAALRGHVGPDAIRGSRRSPVTVVPGEPGT
jgi:hypothetical protein